MDGLPKIPVIELSDQPLYPMPIAPPDIAAAWLDKVRLGILLSLELSFIIFALGFLTALGPGFDSAVNKVIIPIISLAYCFTGWLTTTPEPGNPYWLIWWRWSTRAGLFIGLGVQVISFAALFFNESQIADVEPTFLILTEASFLTTGCSLLYNAYLSKRIKASLLKIWFSIVGVICLVIAISVILVSIYDRAGAVTKFGLLTNKAKESSPDQFWFSEPKSFITYTLFFLVSFCISWFFYRKLKLASKALKEINGTSVSG